MSDEDDRPTDDAEEPVSQRILELRQQGVRPYIELD